MADDTPGTPRMWCPFCLTPVDDRTHCQSCGLPQHGPKPARLRVVVARLHDVSEELQALQVEQHSLGAERVQLLTDIRGEPAPGTPPPAVLPPIEPMRGVADWRPERVRDALLWLGAILLALSAITFAIVAWARLDPAGRAGLLLGATAIAGGSAFGLRNRLRATAEALTGLTLALALVDWYVLRRAGVSEDVEVTTWWAIGTALVAGLSLAAALRLQLRSARLAAPLLGLASGAFAIGATTSALWVAAVGSTLVASLAVVGANRVNRRAEWRDVALVLTGGCIGFEIGAVVLAFAAVAGIDRAADALGPAISILALGLAPAFAVVSADKDQRTRTEDDVLVGLTAAAVIGAPVAFVSGDLGSMGLAAFAAGLGVVAVAWGRVAPERLRLGPAGAGSIAIAIGLVAVSSRVVLAVAGPLDWFSDAWSGSLTLPAAEHFSPIDATILSDGWATVAVLLAAAIGVAAGCARPNWRAALMPVAPGAPIVTGSLVGALAVALPASGASIGVTLAVELTAAVALVATAAVLDVHRVHRPSLGQWLLGGAAILMVTVAGWSVVESSATVVVLAVIAVTFGLAGAWMRVVPSRIAVLAAAALAGVAEAGAVTGATTDSLGPAGFAVAVAAGAVLVVGALGRKAAPEGPALEAVGLVGLVVGLGLCSDSTEWFAAALTVSAAALGAATLRRERPAYAWFTALAAVGAMWAWLAAAEVSVLEAYTVPAALVLLGAGWLRRRADHDIGSWAAYGPALVLGLGPSLLVALDRGGAARPIGLIAVSVACVLVGSRRGLSAPLTLGAVALVAIAVENLGPVAAQAPRWLLLGAIGLLMLWLGASAERRLNQLRRWRTALKHLA